MANYKINGPSFVLSCSEKVKIPLMVCSHERSGTHFMMNSISECTEYTVSPFLNFDYMPLGSFVNFFSKESMNKFLLSLQDISRNEYSNHCVNSIIKSHFPLSILDHNNNLCRVIYIYRNPEEVFISYWKFLHRWNWLEGPKLNSPLELIKTNPKGQSQRYQIENYTNYPDTNEVPRPEYWSGWRLIPNEIEFWLDGENRIHERLKYKFEQNKWDKFLLSP